MEKRIRKISANTVDKVQSAKIAAFQEVMARALLASRFGTDTYSGNRNVYQALGWPQDMSYTDYLKRYKRQDVAKAVIDRPVKASWKGEITVIENIEDKQTPFEKEWLGIYKRLKLRSVLMRCDKLTGLGRYSVLFLGLNDFKAIEDLMQPVKKKSKLLYVRPLSEENAKIDSTDKDPFSARYGLPEYYNLTIKSGENSTFVKVHHSRVIHFVEDILEDEVYGTPRLEVVYNRLLDLEKLIGGDAEMFWRGARPGYTGVVDKEYELTQTMKDDLMNQVNEFEHNLRRVLVNEGVKYEALAQQIADPTSHVDVQIQMLSAATGIPKRILTGSERGELSSAQDKLEWLTYVSLRREEQNEPMILRPFIDKLIEIEVLPKPKEYIIKWDELFSLTELEKIEFSIKQAIIIEKYTTSAISEYIPMDLFLKYFLNFSDTQISKLISNRERAVQEEEELTPEEDNIIKEEQNNGQEEN